MRSQMIGIGQQVGRAHDEHAAARPVQRARADAREVGEQRAEARAPLEVAEEVRVRRVRVVDDGRGRARLVRDEEVHLEAVQARRVLGVVLLLARPLLLLVLVLELDEVVPVLDERLLHALELLPRRRRRACRTRATIAFMRLVDDAGARPSRTPPRARPRSARSARARAARPSRPRCVSFSSPRSSARLVDSSSTSNCSALTGLPCRIGNVCTPPWTGRTPKPSDLASDSSWWMTARFFASSSRASCAWARLNSSPSTTAGISSFRRSMSPSIAPTSAGPDAGRQQSGRGASGWSKSWT